MTKHSGIWSLKKPTALGDKHSLMSYSRTSTATRLLAGLSVGCPKVKPRDFSLLLSTQAVWETHPSSHSMSNTIPGSGVKRSELTFDTSPPSSGKINPLKTKRRPLYLKPQFVPHSKHLLTWMYKLITGCPIGRDSLFVARYLQNM